MAFVTSGGPIVGLDIGSHYIKIVEVKGSRSGPQITGIGVLPTPSDAFSGDLIVNPPALGAVLKKALREAGISTKKCVSAVSGLNSFVMRIISLPKMTEKELADTMRWEVERYAPFPVNEIVKDYKPLLRGDEPEDQQNMNVLLVVAQQQLIDTHLEAILAAGLEPLAIDAEPLALYRTAKGMPEIDNKNVLFIHSGHRKTDMLIYERGLLTIHRTIPLAGENLTRAIADYMALPEEQAERHKKQYAEVTGLAGTTGFGFGSDMTGFLGAGISAEGTEERGVQPAQRGINLDQEEGQLDFSLWGIEPEETPSEEQASEAEQPSEPTSAQPRVLFTPEEAEGTPAPVVREDETHRLVREAITPVVSDLVQEIRSTVQYFLGRAEGGSLDQIYISGGTARLKGFQELLENDLGIPVEVLHPSRCGFQLVSKALSPGYFEEIGPVLTVALGLAVRDLIPEPVPPSRRSRKGKVLTPGGEPK